MFASYSDVLSHPHRRKGHLRPGGYLPDHQRMGPHLPISPTRPGLTRPGPGDHPEDNSRDHLPWSGPKAEGREVKGPNPDHLAGTTNAGGRIPRRCRQSRLAAAQTLNTQFTRIQARGRPALADTTVEPMGIKAGGGRGVKVYINFKYGANPPL
jgi:hypothetical protein